jgi:hypothetical protein
MNKHKQQAFWQIFFPMILITGGFAFFPFSFFGKTLLSELNPRIWSDISLLYIILPLFLAFVLLFIILFLIIYLLSRCQLAIGAFLSNINDISTITTHWASKLTNYLTHPLIQIEAFISQLLPQKKDKN